MKDNNLVIIKKFINGERFERIIKESKLFREYFG